MICPESANKDFDDLTCQDCKWYMQCFKMWQNGNIWGKEKAIGDNFPMIKHDPSKIDKIRPITQEEIDKFKIELEEFDLFVDDKNFITLRRKK
jgi:hypothetical protein